MRNSEYFRAQARLYRDLAQLMSDPKASEKALTTAADYLDKADEMERVERNAQHLTNEKLG